jgi:hypothetical protein
MVAYLLAFVAFFFPHLTRYQQSEARAIADEVAHTDGTPQEDLRPVNIAAMESYFDRRAVGKLGERGAWQILGGRDFSAREALRRMRVLGMQGFVGCTRPCPAIVAHRVDRADLWRMAMEPPRDLGAGVAATP